MDSVARVAADEIDEGVQAAIDGELALLEPEVRSSPARAERLLDEEFVEVRSSGRVWDRASLLAAMAGPLSAATSPSSPSMSVGFVSRRTWCT